MSNRASSTAFGHSLSVKAKLFFVIAVLLCGMAGYGVYQKVSFDQLHALKKAAAENQTSEINLLTLRRHEKDFLARQDPKYIDRFDDTFIALQRRIATLVTVLAKYSQADKTIDTIQQTLTRYQQQFHRLAKTSLALGTQQSGHIGELALERLALKNAAIATASITLKVSLLEMFELEFLYLSDPTPENLVVLNQKVTDFKGHLDQYTGLSPQFKSYYDQLQTVTETQAVIGLSADQGMRGQLRKNVHQTEEAIHKLQNKLDVIVKNKSQTIERNLFMIGALIAVIVSLIMVYLARSISNRIGSINELMSDIAQGSGDLTVRMNAKGNDELAQLANSFDLFVAKLHNNIVQVSQVMTTLQQSVTESEQSAALSMRNTNQQRIESESVATAVNELVMTSNEITANIENAASTAQHIRDAAENGLELSERSGQQTHALIHQIENSQTHIKALSKQSEEIHTVISSIQRIAEQTNLLALNAAIEAARAGESGRGFAVVADEVRQLSLMTNDSTHQIEQTISGLSDSVTKVVGIMGSSLEHAHQTKHSTESSVNSINQIVLQISEMSDMTAQIATASEEQSMVSADIDRNITQIAELAASTYQTAEANVASSSQIQQVSQKLEHIVAQFKY